MRTIYVATKPGHKIIYEKRTCFGTPGHVMVPHEVPESTPDDLYERIEWERNWHFSKADSLHDSLKR